MAFGPLLLDRPGYDNGSYGIVATYKTKLLPMIIPRSTSGKATAGPTVIPNCVRSSSVNKHAMHIIPFVFKQQY